MMRSERLTLPIIAVAAAEAIAGTLAVGIGLKINANWREVRKMQHPRKKHPIYK